MMKNERKTCTRDYFAIAEIAAARGKRVLFEVFL
jgi:hypothetical protein